MSAAGCSYARFADVAHAVNEQSLNLTDYVARCDDACVTIFGLKKLGKLDVSGLEAMTTYVIQFSMISFFGPFLPLLMHLLRSQKSHRMTRFTQSLHNLRGTVQKTHLLFSNALFVATLWRIYEKPPHLETDFITALVQTQYLFSYSMTSSSSSFSDLDLIAVKTPWTGRNAISGLVQLAVTVYISARKGPMDKATIREAALACHNIRGTIDVSKTFAEYPSSLTLFLWIGGAIGIVIALVLVAIYTSPGKRACRLFGEWWTRVIRKKGFHINLLVVSILTMLGMTINLFTARRKMQQFSGAQHDGQWKFAQVAAILWLPLFIDIFKELWGNYTALSRTETSDTTEEQKSLVQTTRDEKPQITSLPVSNSTGQQTIDQHFPKRDEGKEWYQYASGAARRKDTEEKVGMITLETARRRTPTEQTQIEGFVEEPESACIHPAAMGS